MPSPREISPTEDPPCETKEAAKQKQLESKHKGCRHCHLEGHFMIFHRHYNRMPTIEIEVNGELKQVRAAITCHCSCEVGRWMRRYTDKELLPRIPVLKEVGIGPLKNWSTLDPTLDDYIEDDVPDWAGWRERLKAMSRGAVVKVYPKSDGNRAAAYREMGEQMPGSIPA
jgi:hypothetical protein